VKLDDLNLLAEAVRSSYRVQIDEGMEPIQLPSGALASKYCGGGHGGYALILFPGPEPRKSALEKTQDLRPIEPFSRL
jgi:hypothetical protein